MFGCFVMSGCGDPIAGRLESGQMVLTVPMGAKDFQGNPIDEVFMGPYDVGAGSEARVVKDEEVDGKVIRGVLVVMTTGPKKGESGRIARNELRPAK